MKKILVVFASAALCLSTASAQYNQIYDSDAVSHGSGNGAIWLLVVLIGAALVFGGKGAEAFITLLIEIGVTITITSVSCMWVANYLLGHPKGIEPSWLGLGFFAFAMYLIVKNRKSSG